MDKEKIKKLEQQIDILDKKQDALIKKFKAVRIFVSYMQDKYFLRTEIERIQDEDLEDG
jgi:hypothetical protein